MLFRSIPDENGDIWDTKPLTGLSVHFGPPCWDGDVIMSHGFDHYGLLTVKTYFEAEHIANADSLPEPHHILQLSFNYHDVDLETVLQPLLNDSTLWTHVSFLHIGCSKDILALGYRVGRFLSKALVQLPDTRLHTLHLGGECVTALSADRKSTRLNSSHSGESRMPSSA